MNILEQIALILFKLSGRPYPNATRELPSQEGFIKGIRFAFGEVSFDVPEGTWLSLVTDTNSMDGVVDIGDTCILAPAEPFYGKLRVGDIVVYDPYYVEINGLYTPTKYIMHRIIGMGIDGGGRYYYTRGDNTASADPYTLRDRNIRFLLGAVIYKAKEE